VVWLVVFLCLYWGMSLGLLGAMYSEQDRTPPRLADALVLFTVGPMVMAWLCGARAIRALRRR